METEEVATDDMQIDDNIQQTPEPDLQVDPEDPIMDMVTGNNVPNHQFEQVINAFHARHNSTPTKPKYKINTHRTYHISKANASEFASLIDRRANGGLAGADVRVLSRSPVWMSSIVHHWLIPTKVLSS